MKVLSTKIVNWKNMPFHFEELPFIRIRENILDPHPDLQTQLIFSSGNAVRSFVNQFHHSEYRNKKIFCVGNTTASLLKEYNMLPQISANTSESLANEIIKQVAGGTGFSFLCGNRRRDELPSLLRGAGYKLDEIEIYTTELSSIEIKEKYDVILFFSPSAVESFLQKNKITNELCLCIGNTTANELNGMADNIQIADEPSSDYMKKMLLQQQLQ